MTGPLTSDQQLIEGSSQASALTWHQSSKRLLPFQLSLPSFIDIQTSQVTIKVGAIHRVTSKVTQGRSFREARLIKHGANKANSPELSSQETIHIFLIGMQTTAIKPLSKLGKVCCWSQKELSEKIPVICAIYCCYCKNSSMSISC